MKIKLMPPSEIVARLDLELHGQALAKQRLAFAAYRHFFQFVDARGGSRRAPLPQHIMILGPTGCGKTSMVKALARIFDVPFFYVNAAQLTAEGYVGESVGDALARFPSVDKNGGAAIVLLDEVDKLISNIGTSSGMDVRGGPVQQELLSVLDGNRLTRTKEGARTTTYDIDTSKFLFVGCGAFVGLEAIVRKRLAIDALGFSARTDKPNSSLLVPVPDDLIKFGFLPEFVGRFPHQVVVDELSRADLVAILESPSYSPLYHHIEFFARHGVALDFCAPVIQAIAVEAQKRKTGARALPQVVSSTLANVDWRVPDLVKEGINSVVVKEYKGNGMPAAIELGHREQSDLVEKESESTAIASSEKSETKVPSTDTRVQELKRGIGLQDASAEAQKWWKELEEQKTSTPELILSLLETLRDRKISIDELEQYRLQYAINEPLAIVAFVDFYRSVHQTRVGSSRGFYAKTLHNVFNSRARAIVNYSKAADEVRCWWDSLEATAPDGPAIVLVAEALCARGMDVASALDLGAAAWIVGAEVFLNFLAFWDHCRDKALEIEKSLSPIEQTWCGELRRDERKVYLAKIAGTDSKVQVTPDVAAGSTLVDCTAAWRRAVSCMPPSLVGDHARVRIETFARVTKPILLSTTRSRKPLELPNVVDGLARGLNWAMSPLSILNLLVGVWRCSELDELSRESNWKLELHELEHRFRLDLGWGAGFLPNPEAKLQRESSMRERANKIVGLFRGPERNAS